ncbi:MAG: ABC transporter permease [Nitrosomonadales bacterium]|jgi:cell division transport system permease protein|nr:ABC transporter permease [Nitrosomonadales bacterium]|tara:strand:- start:13749 stop:14648 length:900 start_codon:yes stop_codon:yes gene_type:complete
MFHYFHNHIQAFLRAVIRIKSNWPSSIIMILVIGITLCLPATGFLLVENASQLSSKIEYEAEISIFLDQTISQDQINFIGSALKQTSSIEKVNFEPKIRAWEKLQEKLKINSLDAGISENPLPDAFFVTLNTLDHNIVESLHKDIKNLEGVKEVIIDSGWIKKLRSILYLIKVGLLILGTLLAMVLIVVIGNTIRLQTLTYQNEIEVSRLIGATDSFIQRPFIYTGIFYGLGGSLVTGGLLTVILELFNRVAFKFESILGGLIMLTNLPPSKYIFITIFAMALGLLASYFSASRSIKTI